MAQQTAIPPEAPRVYCPDLPHPRLGEPSCSLDADQTRHLRKALRLNVGDPVELVDGKGGLGCGHIAQFEQQQAICRLDRVSRYERPTPQLTVATAIPKGPRGEDMIEQLSQLGVDRVIPLKTERSVVHPRPQKRERFRKAAIESTKQSGRLFLMQLEELQPLTDLLTSDADVTLALSTRGQITEPRRDGLRQAQHVRLLIGPEGGFTNGELEQMRAAGAELWTIGPTVLRIETAAVAATAITRFLACADSQ